MHKDKLLPAQGKFSLKNIHVLNFHCVTEQQKFTITHETFANDSMILHGYNR